MSEKLSERKQKILKAVVDEYITSASPISSGEIQSKHFEEISSATIRNELSALEGMGYLIQPHTSSGRVPSKKAYTLYVDKFLQKQPLTKKEISLIESTFNERFNEIEDIVRTTAKVISDITNYTSVIVLKNINKVRLKEIKLVNLDKHSILVVIITDSGIIRDKVINTIGESSELYVKDANALLNKMFAGKMISQLKSPEELINNELQEFRELYISIIEILESYVDDAEDVYMEGQSKFLQSPDHDLQSAKDFLQLIDSKESLKDMIDSNQDIEFSVKIGKDDKGGIEKCAIVTAKYKFKGQEIGRAGVIGPERMDYNKVVSVLKYIGTAVEEISNGGDDDKKR